MGTDSCRHSLANLPCGLFLQNVLIIFTNAKAWGKMLPARTSPLGTPLCQRPGGRSTSSIIFWGGGNSLFAEKYSLFAESFSPELCGVCLCDPECVSLEKPARENAFQLCQHMAEDQGQFCKVAPAGLQKQICLEMRKQAAKGVRREAGRLISKSHFGLCPQDWVAICSHTAVCALWTNIPCTYI